MANSSIGSIVDSDGSGRSSYINNRHEGEEANRDNGYDPLHTQEGPLITISSRIDDTSYWIVYGTGVRLGTQSTLESI